MVSSVLTLALPLPTYLVLPPSAFVSLHLLSLLGELTDVGRQVFGLRPLNIINLNVNITLSLPFILGEV